MVRFWSCLHCEDIISFQFKRIEMHITRQKMLSAFHPFLIAFFLCYLISSSNTNIISTHNYSREWHFHVTPQKPSQLATEEEGTYATQWAQSNTGSSPSASRTKNHWLSLKLFSASLTTASRIASNSRQRCMFASTCNVASLLWNRIRTKDTHE